MPMKDIKSRKGKVERDRKVKGETERRGRTGRERQQHTQRERDGPGQMGSGQEKGRGTGRYVVKFKFLRNVP